MSIVFFPFIIVILYIPIFYLKERGFIFPRLKKHKNGYDPQIVAVLDKYFKFYQNLSQAYKQEFVNRVHYFIINKEFIATEEHEVSNEMKAMIAASAVQITFGFRPMVFAHFDRIIITPDEYFNRFFKMNFKGETSKSGYIKFSWKDFVKGYAIANDSLNLGLHELAHALMIENIAFNEEYHFIKQRDMDRWHELAEPVFERLNNDELKCLRDYGGTNEHEFFAVCVETFYENPAAFKEELPLLYGQLQTILNFDPVKNKRIREFEHNEA